MCDNPIDVFVYTYAHVCMNIYVWFDVCARARISPSEKKKKCKFLLILTLYALCVYMSCKYIYIYMHICICIYMHINIIYIHTYVYILVYIYMYTYIFMHFCLTCQKPQFEDSQNSFRFILDSPNDFQKFVCRSLQYFHFIECAEAITGQEIRSILFLSSCLLHSIFFFFFFFLYRSLYYYYVFLSTFHSILSHRTQATVIFEISNANNFDESKYTLFSFALFSITPNSPQISKNKKKKKKKSGTCTNIILRKYIYIYR